MSTEFIAKLRKGGISLFRDESSTALWNAQRNLSGRTHYADDDTLKCFGARVLQCSITDDGLLLGIVESVSHPSLGRLFRPVFFDVFGTVVSRPEIEDAFKNSQAARNSFWKIANELDAVALTKTALENRRKSLARELGNIETILA